MNSSRPTTIPLRDASLSRAENAATDGAHRWHAERLLVLGVVGVAITAIVVVGLTLIVSGRLHRLTEISRAQTDAIEVLQSRIEKLESQRQPQPSEPPKTATTSQP